MIVHVYAFANVVIKIGSIICGKCLLKENKEITALIKSDATLSRDFRVGEKINTKWKQKYSATVRALLFKEQQATTLQVNNEKLEQNQKSEFDDTKLYARIKIDFTSEKQTKKYFEKVRKSEYIYCRDNTEEDDAGKPKSRTNKHINRISYWKLSHQDCYDLCLNTRSQIAQMAAECMVTQEIMFVWWHRFYTASSFKTQSIMFGFSETSLNRWWKETTDKLLEWAEKTIINSGPEEEQSWTTQRIHERTTNFAKRIHDPLNEGKTIVIMDGTYIFTQEVQTDFEIRKASYSGQKNATLYKPHIICTTMGDVIYGGDVYFSDGQHSDTNIYSLMFNEEYLKKCEQHPELKECVFKPSKVKEIKYFLKIWSKAKGISITDNGYHVVDARNRRPKDVPKNTRVPTVWNAWKRRITCIRQVIERVNKNIKRWRLIGSGGLTCWEIPNLSKYTKIAIGHHNTYTTVLQKDHEQNELLTTRLLEIQTIITNPCDRFWKQKPPPRKRDDKSVPLPPKSTPPFDDGFKTVAQGWDLAVKWIKDCSWIQDLELKLEDAQDLVGRYFQHTLVDRYMKKLEKNFRIKICKTENFVIKFENLKSKYKAATHRHVILCFQQIINHRIGPPPPMEEIDSMQQSDDFQRNHNQSEDTGNVDELMLNNEEANDEEMKVDDDFELKEKQWKDINFDLWETDLARLQYYCTCNAGAQMVNPCAHVATCIYLIVWIMNDLLEAKLKISKRDQRIKDSVINLGPGVDYLNKQRESRKGVELYCICRQPWRGFMVRCKCCEEWYHPDCLDLEISQEFQEQASDFKCHWCDPYINFISKLKQKEKNGPTGPSTNAPPLEENQD